MSINTPEFLVDQISSVNVQGPLVTVHFVRNKSQSEDQSPEQQEKLQVTMLAPNFLNTVNALNNVAKRMIEKNKDQESAAKLEANPET
jgi:hypothetical protein